MPKTAETSALFKWLQIKDSELSIRVSLLRKELGKWLPRIVQLFPHYPSHDLDHSDRIVLQLSKLLFKDRKPTIPLSPAEVYCLLCAAYLHDSGMVVSPDEQTQLLASESWREFISPEGAGYSSYTSYEKSRERAAKIGDDASDFVANAALRYILADFVRRTHHERGRLTLATHPFLKQLIDDGDAVTLETISTIGAAHGFQSDELTDLSRFPEERDVLGDKVNVRFMARLLRIGDLLDLDSHRADPVTLLATGPLPKESKPHWGQYSSKRHESISPKSIDYEFYCRDQDTHRILRDWFSWLESEVRVTGYEQINSRRHSSWKAPKCLVTSFAESSSTHKGPQPTIIIRPAKDAKYSFHDWRLEADHERVLKLLIHDVYQSPVVFVRELIQNSLDASRCQMYEDFRKKFPDATIPERPTQLPPSFRNEYPIRISLKNEETIQAPNPAPQKQWVFTIEDRGVGMDESIITRYFLQIGRSYYKSHEFKKKFKFTPTSRFGIGFLSVFAVSENISVETARRETPEGKGIKMILRDPRNYLITEPWDPFTERPLGARHGTRIRIVLNSQLEVDSIEDLLKRWCVATEVPIYFQGLKSEMVILPEKLVDKTVLRSSKIDANGQFQLRVFDLNEDGFEGQFGLVAYSDGNGEGWCNCWPNTTGLDGKLTDPPPAPPVNFDAFHGIADPFRSGLRTQTQWFARIDSRSVGSTLPLSRRGAVLQAPPASLRASPGHSASVSQRAIQKRLKEVLEDHLASSPRARGELGVRYVGKVLSVAPIIDDWRDQFPATVPTWSHGKRSDFSGSEILGRKEISFALWDLPPSSDEPPPMLAHPRDCPLIGPIISWGDTPSFLDPKLSLKLRAANLVRIENKDDLWLFTFSEESKNPEVTPIPITGSSFKSWIAPIPDARIPSLHLRPLDDGATYFSVLNSNNPLISWALKIMEPARGFGIGSGILDKLWISLADRPWDVDELLDKWRKDPQIPQVLRPPADASGRFVFAHRRTLGGRPTI